MGCDWYSQVFLVVTYKNKDGQITTVLRDGIETPEYIWSYREYMPKYDSDDEEPPMSYREVEEKIIEDYVEKNPTKMLYKDGEWLIRNERKIEQIKRDINCREDFPYGYLYDPRYLDDGFPNEYWPEQNKDYIEMEDVISIQRMYSGRKRG